MELDKKEKLQTQMDGIRDSITDRHGKSYRCHWNVGESLNYLRNKILEQLSEDDREIADNTIHPLYFEKPKPGDTGVWCIEKTEANRLIYQLNVLLDSPHKARTISVNNKEIIRNEQNIGGSKTGKVFVVHGHDEAAKHTVAPYLEKLDLGPVILSKRPNEGKTIIEKFEQNSDVEFAIVLLTPDDIGYSSSDPDCTRNRARQNVILELGYFIGKLSRNRVCALTKGKVEIPSDYHGVIYIDMDDAGAWKLLIGKEMRQAGLSIDLNKAA